MYGKFLVEGDKLVHELLLSDFKIEAIYSVKEWQLPTTETEIEQIIVSEDELMKISTHENPNQVVAVAVIPQSETRNQKPEISNELIIACDNLNDPGNAGAIIRIADWFKIDKVLFSENSVDVYNPKTVSAAKGSLFRVKCFYVDLRRLITENSHLKIYGALMSGENIYTSSLNENGIILIGNEANGISAELLPFINHKISIPAFGKAESLNAAVACGIIVSEFRRRG